MANNRQFREKTTINKAGEVVRESIPLDPTVPPIDEEEQEQAEQEEELSPQEEAYYEVTSNLVRNDLKLRISRIKESGSEVFCGSISPEEVKTRGIESAIQSRFGKGRFKVDFVDISTDRPISTIIEVDGPADPTAPEGPAGMTINMPKGSNEMAPFISLLSNQLQESQRLTNALILKLADNKAQPATVGGMSIEQLHIMKEIFTSKRDDSGEKLKEWLGLIKTLVENVAPMIQPQSDNPWIAFAQTILPNVQQAIGTIASKVGGPKTAPAPTRTPIQQQPAVNHPVGASVAPEPRQEGVSAEVEAIREMFSGMYLNPLIQAASEGLDPYAMTFNFRAQLAGDTTKFFPSLGLVTVSDFYKSYPDTLQYTDWFNEFFHWMANPTMKPEPDEEEEEVLMEEPVVPKNGTSGTVTVLADKKKKGKKEAVEPEVLTGDAQ